MTQMPLNLFARQADRSRAAKYRNQVFDVLADGAWHRAKSLCAGLPGLTDRALRQIAEESRGTVISGQNGYRLTRFASTEEIDHCERWLLSQSQHMKERALEIRRARNSGGVAA